MARTQRFDFTIDAGAPEVAVRLKRRTRARDPFLRGLESNARGFFGWVHQGRFALASGHRRWAEGILYMRVRPVAKGRVEPLDGGGARVHGTSAVPLRFCLWFLLGTISLLMSPFLLTWDLLHVQTLGDLVYRLPLAVILPLTLLFQVRLGVDLCFPDHRSIEDRLRAVAAEPSPPGQRR